MLAGLNLESLKQHDRILLGPIQERSWNPVISCTGRIELPPTALNSVHAKAGGQVVFLKYLPGDYVKKGALVVTIENPGLIEKQRSLLETKANLEFAEKDYERKKALKAGQATAEKTFDESENRYALLRATYLGLKEELSLLGVDLTKLETEARFQPRISVYAPEAGYVHEVFVNKGQMVSPETALMEIADIRDLHLELQVLSKDIAEIQVGQAVQFTLAGHTKSYAAEVMKINPMVDPERSTLQVHCHIDEAASGPFVAGLYADAHIQLAAKKVQGLPLDAVVKEGEHYFGYRLHDEGVKKQALTNAQLHQDFVSFDGDKSGQWVIAGGYYLE